MSDNACAVFGLGAFLIFSAYLSASSFWPLFKHSSLIALQNFFRLLLWIPRLLPRCPPPSSCSSFSSMSSSSSPPSPPTPVRSLKKRFVSFTSCPPFHRRPPEWPFQIGPPKSLKKQWLYRSGYRKHQKALVLQIGPSKSFKKHWTSLKTNKNVEVVH